MTYGNPFDRKEFLKDIAYYVEHHWGSYNELIQLSVKDIIEIRIGIESKEQEDKLSEVTSPRML